MFPFQAWKRGLRWVISVGRDDGPDGHDPAGSDQRHDQTPRRRQIRASVAALHAVAVVALRTPRLTELAYDEELIALRLLADRRDELSRRRVQTVNRLQRLLTELVPGGAKRDLSAQQAMRLLATVRPRSLVGKTIRRMVTEEIADLVAVDAKRSRR